MPCGGLIPLLQWIKGGIWIDSGSRISPSTLVGTILALPVPPVLLLLEAWLGFHLTFCSVIKIFTLNNRLLYFPMQCFTCSFIYSLPYSHLYIFNNLLLILTFNVFNICTSYAQSNLNSPTLSFFHQDIFCICCSIFLSSIKSPPSSCCKWSNTPLLGSEFGSRIMARLSGNVKRVVATSFDFHPIVSGEWKPNKTHHSCSLTQE